MWRGSWLTSKVLLVILLLRRMMIKSFPLPMPFLLFLPNLNTAPILLGNLKRESTLAGELLLELQTLRNEPLVWYEIVESTSLQPPRFTKQRTEAWLNLRKDGALSSSLAGTALGFHSNLDAFELQESFLYEVSQLLRFVVN
jgi:hypothetical protein